MCNVVCDGWAASGPLMFLFSKKENNKNKRMKFKDGEAGRLQKSAKSNIMKVICFSKLCIYRNVRYDVQYCLKVHPFGHGTPF